MGIVVFIPAHTSHTVLMGLESVGLNLAFTDVTEVDHVDIARHVASSEARSVLRNKLVINLGNNRRIKARECEFEH